MGFKVDVDLKLRVRHPKWEPSHTLMLVDLYVSYLLSIVCSTLLLLSDRSLLGALTLVEVAVPFLYVMVRHRESTGALAYDVHFTLGVVIVQSAYLLGKLWLVPLVLVLELFFKEGLFDQFVEDNPIVFGGLLDFLTYCAGSALTFLLIYV